jgi:hypothetical protein
MVYSFGEFSAAEVRAGLASLDVVVPIQVLETSLVLSLSLYPDSGDFNLCQGSPSSVTSLSSSHVIFCCIPTNTSGKSIYLSTYLIYVSVYDYLFNLNHENISERTNVGVKKCQVRIRLAPLFFISMTPNLHCCQSCHH